MLPEFQKSGIDTQRSARLRGDEENHIRVTQTNGYSYPSHYNTKNASTPQKNQNFCGMKRKSCNKVSFQRNFFPKMEMNEIFCSWAAGEALPEP